MEIFSQPDQGLHDALHVDHHGLAFGPGANPVIYEGNDGGIYVSDDSGDSWTKLYDQHTNEFYAIEIDYLHPERLYGGTQDNSTVGAPLPGDGEWGMFRGWINTTGWEPGVRELMLSGQPLTWVPSTGDELLL